MTIPEKNKYFCQFIKEHFGIEPKPILHDDLKSLYHARAAVYMHYVEEEAEMLGYTDVFDFDGSWLFAPWHSEDNDEEAFSSYARDDSDLNDIGGFEEFLENLDADEDGGDEFYIARDIQEYRSVYYVVYHMDTPVGLEDII